MKITIQKYLSTVLLILIFNACGGSNNETNDNVLSGTTTVNNSTLAKTGQEVIYKDYDDGYYKIGVNKIYTRDNGKQVITDNLSNLMWQDNKEPTTLTLGWSSAKSYCSNLVLASYRNWRLPTRKELHSIVDYGKYNPSMDKTFKNIEVYNNWTSTVSPRDTDKAWTVFFVSGEEDLDYKTNYGNVRCVRTKQ